MDKIVLDQAEGLRRLLSRDVARIVAVIGGTPGAGGTSAVANLAAALVGHGKDVVALDECGGPHSLCAGLGVRAPGTLADLATHDLRLDQAAARTGDGVLVLPAPRAGVAGFTGAELVTALTGAPDIVLIDTDFGVHGTLSPLAMQAHDVVVVMRVDAQSITSTYASVKRLHYTHGIRQCRVLINGAANGGDAQGVFRNLSDVAGRYLAVALAPAGAISIDPLVARSRGLARSVVDAFPAAPASVDFRRVAGKLLHWPWRPAAQRPASDATATVDRSFAQPA